MALFTDPPELTCGFEQTPKNSQFGDGMQGSKQIFNSSGTVFTANIALNDSTGAAAVFPFVLKRSAGVWSIPDLATWQAEYDLTLYDSAWNDPSQCQSGGKIHMMSGLGGSPFDLLYWPFDMTSGGGAYVGNITAPYSTGPSTSSESVGTTRVAPLSDGRLMVAWGGPANNVAGKFTLATPPTFPAGTVYAAAGVGTRYRILGLAVDASDTSHILYRKELAGVSSMWHVTVDSGGSVGTTTLIEASGADYSCGPGCMFRGNVTFTISKAFDANIYLLESDPVTISWTKKPVAARTNDTGGGVFPVPVIFSSSALWIHWWEQDNTLYPASTAFSFYSVYDGSSFTAKAIGWDAGANQYPGAGVVPDGDIDMSALTAEYDGTNMQLLGWSEFTSSFDESELYLQVALAGQSGYRNRAKLSLG